MLILFNIFIGVRLKTGFGGWNERIWNSAMRNNGGYFYALLV